MAVFNCHESWVHQLRYLDYDLDIIVGLTGRDRPWDERMRPLPPRARMITLSEARGIGGGWETIICSNIRDLMDARELKGPKLLVLHVTLEGRLVEEKIELTVEQMRKSLADYVALSHVHVTAISPLKGRSWGFVDDIVPCAVDVADYPVATCELAVGLRVSNQVSLRPRILLWELHEAAFSGLPVRLVGHNPDRPGVEPSRDWDDLRELLRVHRFFVHTAEPGLEDGYNLASLEAMATGLPVLSNAHPTSPIVHGKSGFLSDDPRELRSFAERLLADRELALELGAEARRQVQERFSHEHFRRGFTAAIATSRQLHKAQFGAAKVKTKARRR